MNLGFAAWNNVAKNSVAWNLQLVAKFFMLELKIAPLVNNELMLGKKM